MNTFAGEPVSILRGNLLTLIGKLEEGWIDDYEFIEGVYKVLGHTPPVDEPDYDDSLDGACLCHDSFGCPDDDYASYGEPEDWR